MLASKAPPEAYPLGISLTELAAAVRGPGRKQKFLLAGYPLMEWNRDFLETFVSSLGAHLVMVPLPSNAESCEAMQRNGNHLTSFRFGRKVAGKCRGKLEIKFWNVMDTSVGIAERMVIQSIIGSRFVGEVPMRW